MTDKAKTLGEYKENLGEKLKDLPGSENLKKEYKAKLFREIVADPEYKTLKAEYLNEKRSESSKEKIFQETFAHAKKINPSLIEEDFRTVLIGKTEKKESKEKIEKSLEFEKDTFKIDSTGWKEEERKVYNQSEPMKVKVNETGDVVEYIDWPAKGEQIFIGYDAFLREVCKAKNCSPQEAETKYLMTREEFKQKMADKPDNSDEYKKFFDKEVKWHLAGYWLPGDETFDSVGGRSSVWLAGGSDAGFSENTWDWGSHTGNYGFSVRLLKN